MFELFLKHSWSAFAATKREKKKNSCDDLLSNNEDFEHSKRLKGHKRAAIHYLGLKLETKIKVAENILQLSNN